MKSLRSGEAGQALVMALILLALGAVLVVPTLNLAFTSIKYHEIIEGKTLESYSADSGVHYALAKLRDDPAGYRIQRLDHTFTINDRTVKVIAEYQGDNVYKITSVATSANGKSTTIECCASATSGLFQHVAVSNGKMEIKYTTIDSAPVSGEANLFSNGDFVMANSYLYGSVDVLGTIDISESLITGDVTQSGEPYELPPVDTEFWQDQAELGGTHPGDLNIKDAVDMPLGPLYITGNLQIQDSSIILVGTVYVVGTVQVQASTLVGSEALIAESSVTLQTGAYDTENIPLIMSVNSTILCQAGSIVKAILYAPLDRLTLQGTELYGSAVGKEVTFKDSFLTYVSEVQAIEGLPGSQINIFTYSY